MPTGGAGGGKGGPGSFVGGVAKIAAAAEAAGQAAVKKAAADARGRKKHAAPKKKGAGSAAHRASKQGQQRADKPYQYGDANEFPVLNEDVKTRYWALPATGGEFLLERVESCTWTDADAITTGSITVREDLLAQGADPELRLDQGDRVRCEASDGGRPFREVWTMRVYKPQLAASSGQRTFDLANDLDLLRRSEDYFYYPVKDSRHPHGWTLKQIVENVCARYKVPHGTIATTDKPIHKRVRIKRGSPLEVLRWVMLHERRKFGRRLVLRWDRGKLWLLPLQRSPQLVGLGPTLIEAAFQSELLPEFGSEVIVRANSYALAAFDLDSMGLPTHKRSKAYVVMGSDASRRQFGYVRRILFSPDATTNAELREEAAGFLAEVAKPHKTLTLTHRGMPFLRRGDAIRLALGDAGLRRQVVYVNAVTHTDSPGGYQSQITVIFDDPYLFRPQSILFRLKSDDARAIGQRQPWTYLTNGHNKGDAVGTDQPFTPRGDPVYGGSVSVNVDPLTPEGPFTHVAGGG